MDTYEATRIVYSRIQSFEPQNASKIIGFLLLQDNGDQEMIRLAFGPDILVQALVVKAKKELGLLDFVNSSWSSTFRKPSSIFDPQISPFSNRSWDFTCSTNSLANEIQADGLNFLGHGSGIGRASSRPCLYFARGYCKHGSSCRFLHSPQESIPLIDGLDNDDPPPVLVAGSLERLEVEISELLQIKKGSPISIAALPQLYYEKFGRTLQAEGYLTESQRHGKAGYSLTKLLARLKTVRLIDRPHGQHAIVLAEDASRYTEYKGEGGGGATAPTSNAGSRQIYLTFPAESTFTEEDVSNYFRTYGPVQDVRIPYQQKRMFGFVTFVYPETVKTILAKGNPHDVCGSRVLVKPYKEKGKLADRKPAEKQEFPGYSSLGYNLDVYDFQLGSTRGLDNNNDMGRRQMFFDEHEQVLEMQRRKLAQLHLQDDVSKMSSTNTKFNNINFKDNNLFDFQDPIGTTNEDFNDFSLTDQFSYLLEVLNSDSMNSEKPKVNNTDDHDSYSGQVHINLPDSPFTTPRASYGVNKIPTPI